RGMRKWTREIALRRPRCKISPFLGSKPEDLRELTLLAGDLAHAAIAVGPGGSRIDAAQQTCCLRATPSVRTHRDAMRVHRIEGVEPHLRVTVALGEELCAERHVGRSCARRIASVLEDGVSDREPLRAARPARGVPHGERSFEDPDAIELRVE